MKCSKKIFSMFKLLSTAMAVTIILTGCSGTPGADGRDGVDGKDGKDGTTPTITINKEGYWVINGEVTEYKAVGTDGKNGLNGKDGKDGKDGVNGQDGKDALTPTIEINKDGYWVINGEVTNIKAKGNDGKPGADGKDGKDGQNGVNGTNGVDGLTPTIEINEEGYWVINGVVTEYKAVADEKETITMEGDGQTFHRFAPSTLSFRSTAPLDEFQEVRVNGEVVDPSNYTLTEGSTIVTFNIDYLKTLEKTQHEVTVVSDSVTANAHFEVIEPELNEHGFYYNQPYISEDISEESTVKWIFREDGVAQLRAGEDSFEVHYTIDGDIITLDFLGTLVTATVNEEGIYATTGGFLTLGDESLVADDDYFYQYVEFDGLAGYIVTPILLNKSEYDDIRTGINGLPTLMLAGGAFKNNTNLIVAPKIPDSVTSIGNDAFNGCTNLTSVTIPDGITTIDDGAFMDTNLTSITIPERVTTIGDHAFNDIANLTSIIVDKNNPVYDSRNNSNAIIETSTNTLKFGCKNTIIPESVTSIEDYAFRNNTVLTNITIPASVTSIGVDVFKGCTSLTSIIVDKNNPVYDSRNNSNAIIETSTNRLKFGCKNTIIPESVTKIGSSAFFRSGLTSITIPNSVTTIGKNAFWENQLTSVVIKGKSSTSDFASYGINVFGWAEGYSDANITWQPKQS